LEKLGNLSQENRVAAFRANIEQGGKQASSQQRHQTENDQTQHELDRKHQTDVVQTSSGPQTFSLWQLSPLQSALQLFEQVEGMQEFPLQSDDSSLPTWSVETRARPIATFMSFWQLSPLQSALQLFEQVEGMQEFPLRSEDSSLRLWPTGARETMQVSQ